MNGKTRQPGPDPGNLLRVAEHFLRHRHFDDCRKYAHQAYQADPNFPGIHEILAVAEVLVASERRISTETLPDWYGILQLNRYSQDSDLIRQRFSHLYALLNPSNKFPFAKEAVDLVCDAWYVLSNPLKKLEFDDAIRKHLDDENSKGNSDFTVWTVCPYCYHLYEYPRVYLELCLRCPNEKCSKAFTCVEIDRPPVEVLTEGRYMCAGFLPGGFHEGSWNPFAPLKKEKGNGSDDTGNVVEISDEDDVEIYTKSDKSLNVNGDESVKMDINMPTVKLDSKKKKKSVAKNTKKVTGTGNRVTKQGFGEETDLNIRSTDEDGFENEFSTGFLEGTMDTINGGEVEFYEADDDILVSLHNGI